MDNEPLYGCALTQISVTAHSCGVDRHLISWSQSNRISRYNHSPTIAIVSGEDWHLHGISSYRTSPGQTVSISTLVACRWAAVISVIIVMFYREWGGEIVIAVLTVPVSRSIPSVSVASVSLLGDRSRRDERSLHNHLYIYLNKIWISSLTSSTL